MLAVSIKLRPAKDEPHRDGLDSIPALGRLIIMITQNAQAFRDVRGQNARDTQRDKDPREL